MRTTCPPTTRLAQWNDPTVESQALAWVDGLWKALEVHPDSSTALYGCSVIQLGSQLTTPPDFRYLQAYWSSPTWSRPTHDFVPFLMVSRTSRTRATCSSSPRAFLLRSEARDRHSGPDQKTTASDARTA